MVLALGRRGTYMLVNYTYLKESDASLLLAMGLAIALKQPVCLVVEKTKG